MDVAPPPELVSRIEEWGDRVSVRYSRRWSRWEYPASVAFFVLWVGLAAFTFVKLLEGPVLFSAFLLVWLVGWVGGGAGAMWHAFTKHTLTVAPEVIEHRQERWRLATTKRVETRLVHDVVAVEGRDEDGTGNGAFHVAMKHGNKELMFGGEMTREEAEYVAALVRERLSPQKRRDDVYAWV
jgi:hypothetical protein